MQNNRLMYEHTEVITRSYTYKKEKDLLLGLISCDNFVLKKIKRLPKESFFKLAGISGFEPLNEGVKVPCLTAWLYPYLKCFLSIL